MAAFSFAQKSDIFYPFDACFQDFLQKFRQV
jgi:hypothetical protein